MNPPWVIAFTDDDYDAKRDLYHTHIVLACVGLNNFGSTDIEDFNGVFVKFDFQSSVIEKILATAKQIRQSKPLAMIVANDPAADYLIKGTDKTIFQWGADNNVGIVLAEHPGAWVMALSHLLRSFWE